MRGEGLRIAIIGGGPAGAACALALARQAQRLHRDISLTIFEPKHFTEYGPRGCNLCAGIISRTLIENLQGLGVVIPQATIQREITGYLMVTRGGCLRLARPAGSRIYAVYRGMGPRGLGFDEARSFDALLLREAVTAGARLVPVAVRDLTLPQGQELFELLGADGSRHWADVVVGAFGINSPLARRLEAKGVGYRRPRAIRACQAELAVGEAFLRRKVGGEVRIFNLGLPGIRFGALVPKDRHLTVSLVGDDVGATGLEAFLEHPLVRVHLPSGWKLPRTYCRCQPLVPVSAAHVPRQDRLFIVGDAHISRLFKDGIGSAVVTGLLAAEAIIRRGGAWQAVRRSYVRHARRRYLWDNVCGMALYRYNSLVARLPLLASAHVEAARREQSRQLPAARPLNDAIWDLFTGDAPYRGVLRQTLRPGVIGRLLCSLLRVTWRRWLRPPVMPLPEFPPFQ